MNERIKTVRNSKGLSQKDFGAKIGISRDTVANIEANRIEIKDIFVTSICREFSINEEWLRTGNGEMFQPITKNDEISKLFGEVLKHGEGNFKHRLINALAKLDENGWENLENLIDMISENK